jgi:HK97 family phage prohead protease
MNTVYGIVADADGLAANTVMVQGRTGPELRKSCFATPAAEVRSVQAPKIPIDRAHDRQWCGEIVYLERRDGNLWAVGHVDGDVIPAVDVRVGSETVRVTTDVYWSAEARMDESYRDIELRSVALTARSARVAARPVRIVPGSLDYPGVTARWQLDKADRELLERAVQARRERANGAPLVIANLGAPADDIEPLRLRASRALQYRSAELADVSAPGRTIDLLIAPAECPTSVVEGGRRLTEVFAHGCFGGCEKNAHRVRVNRDHRFERTIGHAVTLDPWHEAGLIGTLKLARTELADETLALAEEDCLDASAGFLISGEQWPTRNTRRITKAELHHVALTPDPAYTDARIMAVRAGQ